MKVLFALGFMMLNVQAHGDDAQVDRDYLAKLMKPAITRKCGDELGRVLSEELARARQNKSTCLQKVLANKTRALTLLRPLQEKCVKILVETAKLETVRVDDTTPTLRGMFNEAYGPIYRADCLDREVREFQQRQASQPAPERQRPPMAGEGVHEARIRAY